MNAELPRPTYISSWDNVKHFFFLNSFYSSGDPSCDASLLKRHGNPHFSVTGSGSSLLVSGSGDLDASKKSIRKGFFSTGVGRCSLDAGLVLLKDRMQDFFMGVGSWEMANGRWHIGQ